MPKMNRNILIRFIEPNIELFHKKRLESLLHLRLNKVLERKNPYLFKAKNINTAEMLVRSLLNAYLSSQEEGIFGGFLEQLAIFVCHKVYSGSKSISEGIDLEFVKNKTKYIVSIKSGPNWGNSQQIRRMCDNFKRAKKILGSNTSSIHVVAVNGCCYGIDDKPDKGEHLKLCGQRFWEFISGDRNLYTEIIEPLGFKAKEKNLQFSTEYDKVINKFTLAFAKEYCLSSGAINWNKLVEFNSSSKKNTKLRY